MEASVLPVKCFSCTGWDRHSGGFGFCPATGGKTTRDHDCDAPIPEGLPPMETYECRRWAANRMEA